MANIAPNFTLDTHTENHLTKNVACNDFDVKQTAIMEGCCPNHPDVILTTGWCCFKKSKECHRCNEDYRNKNKNNKEKEESINLEGKWETDCDWSVDIIKTENLNNYKIISCDNHSDHKHISFIEINNNKLILNMIEGTYGQSKCSCPMRKMVNGCFNSDNNYLYLYADNVMNWKKKIK